MILSVISLCLPSCTSPPSHPNNTPAPSGFYLCHPCHLCPSVVQTTTPSKDTIPPICPTPPTPDGLYLCHLCHLCPSVVQTIYGTPRARAWRPASAIDADSET